MLWAVATGEALIAVSDDGYRELVKVMGYAPVKSKVTEPARAVSVALDIATMGTFYRPQRLPWPTVPDPKDGWLLDLAYESGADYVVTVDPHFTDHVDELRTLGFEIRVPSQFLNEVEAWPEQAY